MATIDSKAIIDDIIAGKYDDDADLVVKIVQYTNAWGGIAYGCVYRSEARDPYYGNRYEIETAFINNPVVIWRRQK